MNKVISTGHRSFGFIIIFNLTVILFISSMLLAVLIDVTGLFPFERPTLILLVSILIIPSGFLIAAYKWYYKFYVYMDKIEIYFPINSRKKSIRLDEISYIKFNDLVYMYNPAGGVLNIYSSNNKIFTQLTFYDRGSFGHQEIFHVTQYLYNKGVEVEFGKTQKEYKYYTKFFKQNAG